MVFQVQETGGARPEGSSMQEFKKRYISVRASTDIEKVREEVGEGNGNPLQYSCLENPTDRGTTVHGVAKSWTHLDN